VYTLVWLLGSHQGRLWLVECGVVREFHHDPNTEAPQRKPSLREDDSADERLYHKESNLTS